MPFSSSSTSTASSRSLASAPSMVTMLFPRKSRLPMMSCSQISSLRPWSSATTSPGNSRGKLSCLATADIATEGAVATPKISTTSPSGPCRRTGQRIMRTTTLSPSCACIVLPLGIKISTCKRFSSGLTKPISPLNPLKLPTIWSFPRLRTRMISPSARRSAVGFCNSRATTRSLCRASPRAWLGM
ncbi:MAG: hypothetical protein DDT35_01008 [Firmicutes bacterium]|nr:hypothetical protein [Bacillota bacterium]